MPASYVTMWGLLVLMALGAAGELLSDGNLAGAVRAAYPSDIAQSDALHRCGVMDRQFSRFSAGDRENCYRAILPASAGALETPPGDR